MNLTQALTKEYRDLWRSCVVNTKRTGAADAIVDRIAKNKKRYETAGKPLGVPWYVVGIIHTLEGSGNFSTHLHNGDPLTARTVHVPKGRPKSGKPPFTWEESAKDALAMTGLDKWKDWSITGTLYILERYNGFGYRSRGIHSPYLWSFSNHYKSGKFVKDGVFDRAAVSQQCGAAVLLFRMVSRGIAQVEGATTNGKVPKGQAKAKVRTTAQAADDGMLRRGSRGPAVKRLKTQLKKWFDTTAPGEWAKLKIADNDQFGAQLEKAVKIFQARTGLKDDGEVGPNTMAALKERPKKPAPPPKVKDLAFPGVLKRDSAKTEKVRLVQGWLNLHECRVVIDGGFGPATEQALKKFQKQKGLRQTGAVDRATWDALVAPMVRALTPIQKRDTLAKLVVAYAKQHLKEHPHEVGGENRGPWVRLYTDNQEGRAFPWCAGFATWVLKQAADTLGVRMPISRTLACDVMADSCGPGRFIRGDSPGAIKKLKPGSFFVQRGKPGDPLKYRHTGIIVKPDPETMETIEGNTNDEGSAEGFEVCARTRGYKGMDFIIL